MQNVSRGQYFWHFYILTSSIDNVNYKLGENETPRGKQRGIFLQAKIYYRGKPRGM